MITGLTAKSFENLQLDAGVLLVNFAYSELKTFDDIIAAMKTAIAAGESLGATLGGGSLAITPEVRTIELDGMRVDFKGNKKNDKWTVLLTTTLKEFTPAILKTVFATGEIAESTEKDEYTRMRVRNDIDLADYLDNVTWIGDTAYGLMMIVVHNALNTTGGNITYADKGEGNLPTEFYGHSSNFEDIEYAPVEIIMVRKDATTGFRMASGGVTPLSAPTTPKTETSKI